LQRLLVPIVGHQTLVWTLVYVVRKVETLKQVFAVALKIFNVAHGKIRRIIIANFSMY
jgi:hypothetical protein